MPEITSTAGISRVLRANFTVFLLFESKNINKFKHFYWKMGKSMVGNMLGNNDLRVKSSKLSNTREYETTKYAYGW